MPLPVEKLTPDSDMPMIRQMISESMSQCMKEMMEDTPDSEKSKRCAGMIYSMAREKTGKELSEGTQK